MIRILANPFILTFIFFEGCGIYSFTGASIPAGANTFQVDYFENQPTDFSETLDFWFSRDDLVIEDPVIEVKK